ncbi:hypothetical protein BP00DRAFT_266727 [Aspergillus indologenus CBS 114.80]|uniref:DNA glycosylase n=1 Tax=Aspergillus indologenus CBS 114.80 TaxID=1450541 RepID=A0A2V5IIM2_9EURO|nr:hypothetical protein BP00DRAFT_266727 [Aspergillus indologenus CBS 114.80]
MATHKTYDPDHITKETFQTLLARYPSTVESTTRRKVTTTTTEKKSGASSSSSSSRSRPKSKSASKDRASEDPDDASAAVKTYLALDEFRYTTLPDAVRQRASTTIGDDGEGSAYLEKEELVRLVEWKMKHGKFRPALLGMIRSNPDRQVREATGSAFRLMRTADLRETFPGTALETLTGPLRGVGPATGSLVLSVLLSSDDGEGDGEGQGVPFYSDDVFLWLCLGVFPGGDVGRVGKAFKPGKSGELNVKYTVGEYRQLWEAVRRLRARLGVGCAEIEKVAFVVRFGGVDGVDGVEEKEEEGDKEEKEGINLQDTRGKRKRGKNEAEEEEKEQKVGVRRSTRRRGGK